VSEEESDIATSVSVVGNWKRLGRFVDCDKIARAQLSDQQGRNQYDANEL
jgi:hypothetical protein